jgi:hypothetical protein
LFTPTKLGSSRAGTPQSTYYSPRLCWPWKPGDVPVPKGRQVGLGRGRPVDVMPVVVVDMGGLQVGRSLHLVATLW